jgi:UDP-glucose 4-epimerase
MRLLVTGASGFIGKNLLLKVPKDWDVIATYHKSGDFERFLVEKALENVRAVNVDLSDAVDTKRKLEGEFDCAVHLVANTDLSLCARNPHQDLQMNAGTLLNTVKTAKIRDFIFMSSGAVYDGHTGLVSPDVRVDPSFPYAIAKLACEHYVSFFKKSRLIGRYVILRFFGAYGPYEPSRKIFTKLVRAFICDKSRDFTVVGDGNNFIDAMFVDDAIEGLLSVVTSDVRDVTVDFASPCDVES